MTKPETTSVPPEATAATTTGERLRAELVAVVRLAAPVALAHLGMMSMGVVDTMMLGRLSERALAAGALGNSVAVGMFMFPMGILMSLDALMSQAHGAGDLGRMARSFHHGLALAVLLSLPLSAAMWSLEGLLLLLGQKPEIAVLSAGYLRALIPGMVAFLLFVAVRHSLQAISVVRPALVAIVAANLVNAVANYALIFGHFGFPRLGVVGSGYATSLSRWVLFLGLTAAAWPAVRRIFRELPLEIVPRLLGRMLSLGVPIGLQLSVEFWLFMTVALLMGNLGATELAAHQVALSLAALSFMIPLGISGAAATRVGNAIGRGSMAAARRSVAVCIALGGAAMAIPALAFWLLPEALARLFTNVPGVVAAASALLPIAAVFQVADGLQVVAAGGLRGTADTRAPALITLVSFWLLGLPLGWLLAFRAGLGPQGLWWGLTIGLGMLATLMLARIWWRFRMPISALAAS